MIKDTNYYIGADLGTSSCRAVLFNEEGDQIDGVRRTYPVISPEVEVQEQDVDTLTQSFFEVLSEISSKIPNLNRLQGIGLSTYLHSLVPLNSKGQPLTNCIIWTDRRSEPQVEEVKENYDYHELYLRSGCPPHPIYPLFEIIWLRENRPDIFEQTRKFVSMKAYLIWKLYGEYLVDWSIASGMGYFDIHEKKWNEEILDLMGVSRNQLPEPVSPERVLKGMKSELAEEIGIPPKTPLVIGAADGLLSNLGSGAIGKGEANNTVGTGGAVRVVLDEPLLDENERTWCYVLSENYWGIGAVTLGGFAYRWFKDELCKFENKQAESKGKDAYEILNQYSTEISPGSDGIIFLPFLTGELSPNWESNAQGFMSGLSITHTKKHLARSIMEGISYSRRSCIEALEEVSGEITRIRATGGFSQSDEWLQIMSDVLKKNLLVPKVSEDTSLGAAILAMKSLGEISELKDSKKLISYGKTIKPKEENVTIYDKGYELYKNIYDSLAPLFPKLAEYRKEIRKKESNKEDK